MDEATINNLVNEFQPTAYLDRLGKLYNGQAGLGDAAVHNHEGKPTVIHMPVGLKVDGELRNVGSYLIKLNDSLEAVALSYSGIENGSGKIDNQKGKRYVKLDADITPQGIFRMDDYRTIPFVDSDNFTLSQKLNGMMDPPTRTVGSATIFRDAGYDESNVKDISNPSSVAYAQLVKRAAEENGIMMSGDPPYDHHNKRFVTDSRDYEIVDGEIRLRPDLKVAEDKLTGDKYSAPNLPESLALENLKNKLKE